MIMHSFGECNSLGMPKPVSCTITVTLLSLVSTFKLISPLFFGENQVEGVNPHEQLSYEESARIIISHVTEGEKMARKHHLPERFILYVGTIEPRKNLPVLLEAYAALRHRLPEVGLVIAGGKGWLYESFFETLRRLELEPHVHLTTYVPEADLAGLMACATVF